MKIGIIISNNDPEICFNAIRYANYCLGQKDHVKIFLIGKGVECEKISSEKFNITEQLQKFLLNDGQIFACGSCIKLRNQTESKICPINSMKDLYEIVKESDKVITF